jgi:hypothetical protein
MPVLLGEMKHIPTWFYVSSHLCSSKVCLPNVFVLVVPFLLPSKVHLAEMCKNCFSPLQSSEMRIQCWKLKQLCSECHMDLRGNRFLFLFLIICIHSWAEGIALSKHFAHYHFFGKGSVCPWIISLPFSVP